MIIRGIGDDGRTHDWRRLPTWTEHGPEELQRVCDGVIATQVDAAEPEREVCATCATLAFG